VPKEGTLIVADRLRLETVWTVEIVVPSPVSAA
jgi:hypothetical protein